MKKNTFKKFLRAFILTAAYAVISGFGVLLSYYVRFDGIIPEQYVNQMLQCSPWFVGVQVLVLLLLGQSNVVVSYFSLVDLRAILVGNAFSCAVLFVTAVFVGGRIPRGVIMLDFLLVTCGICAVRAGLRFLVEVRRGGIAKLKTGISKPRPVAIIGAGDSGARLVRELLAKPALRWKPVAFFDDDPMKWGQTLHGIPIIGNADLISEMPWRERFRKVIIAAPSAPPARLGQIARMTADLGIESEVLPAIDQLVNGTVKISQLRPIRIEDLLRRPSIRLDQALIYSGLCGKVVAVTGAGGSIGSELCRQILRSNPRQILLIERSEVQLFQIDQELRELGGGSTVVPLIADVTDEERIREVFHRYRPEVIYHAAAHKHVPMMEMQPSEAIRNNSFGTANLAKLAHTYRIARFVLISTDKAINPTNIMGASKRLAEVFLQAFQHANPGPTRFMAVRFGNVLGSSGSVVPTFHRQIAAGGPVTVTHPDVTRYFMTIPEAVGLVLQAGAIGQGGEIFVLDMGDPVKIIDLARQMIELSGYRPDEDIEIRVVGLRPGEKMFEELSHHKEQLTETVHPKIFRFTSIPAPIHSIEEHFGNLQLRLGTSDSAEIKCLVRDIIQEYKPFLG